MTDGRNGKYQVSNYVQKSQFLKELWTAFTPFVDNLVFSPGLISKNFVSYYVINISPHQ